MGRGALIAAAALVLAAGGLGATTAFGGGADPEGIVNGVEADLARDAALRAIGGGVANAVERDPENGATWEVEVVRPGGTTIDVRLDERYNLVVIERDGESSDSE